ncbi:MAG: hypothetical protein ABI833_10000 [Acidobacteriota bacterium]
MMGCWTMALAPLPPAMAQTPSVAAATCPTSFYAAGVSLNPQAIPNLAGWYAIALPITKCDKAFQAYSITMNNLTPRGRGASLTFTSTTSTGLAIPLRQVGPIDIYTFGTLGASVNGPFSSLAGTWGGMAVMPIGRTTWRLTPWAQSIGGKWMGGLGVGRSY